MDEGNKPKYKIVDKHINGVVIDKFTVESLDDSTQKKAISYDDTIKLVRAGKIIDTESLIDTVNQQYLINFNGKLEEIPVHKGFDLQIKCRVLNNEGQCIGYKVVNSDGKVYTLSLAKIWSLATIGCVQGIKAKIICNKKCIIGIDNTSLETLPVITA